MGKNYRVHALVQGQEEGRLRPQGNEEDKIVRVRCKTPDGKELRLVGIEVEEGAMAKLDNDLHDTKPDVKPTVNPTTGPGTGHVSARAGPSSHTASVGGSVGVAAGASSSSADVGPQVGVRVGSKYAPSCAQLRRLLLLALR